jgi:sulfide:quinone oxidoreductase
MMQRVVILGGGTAGTLTANRLRRELGGQTAITVVDRDDDHWYQPGLLFVPFGRARPGRIVRSRARQLRAGIGYHQSAVDHVDVAGRRVHLDSGASLPFEVLVVATGAALLPGETEGLAEAMARGKAFTFYEPAGAAALRDALAGFDGGADRDQRRRHADQVPGCPDRVRLPC